MWVSVKLIKQLLKSRRKEIIEEINETKNIYNKLIKLKTASLKISF